MVEEQVIIKIKVEDTGVKQVTDRIQKNFHGFNQIMGASMERFKKVTTNAGTLNKRFKNMNTPMARFGHRLRMMTHGMRGFRMEMLGVMFFGMNMQRFFIGLIKPSMELVGIFDLWRMTLQMLFLPLSLLLLDFLLPIFLWIMNWSDATKLLVGKLVLLGAAIGFALFVVGMFALGIGAIIMAFGSLFNIIDKLIPDINIAGVNMSSFIEAGLGITLVSTAFKALKGIAGSLLEKLFELDFVGQLLDKLGVKVEEGQTPWETLKNTVSTALDKIKGQLNFETEFDDLGGWIEDIKKTAREWLNEFKTKLDELGISDFVTSIGDISTAVVDVTPDIKTIAGAIRKMADAINAVADAWERVKKYVKYKFPAGAGSQLVRNVLAGRPFTGPSGFGVRVAPGRQVTPPLAGTTAIAPGVNLDVSSGFMAKLREAGLGDFIWRPGQAPVPFSSRDTLIGTKGGGAVGTNITLSPTYYITGVSSKEDIERMIDDNNRKLVDDLRRMVRFSS